MRFKRCEGPRCRGAERPYSAFEPDVGEADFLRPMCRVCDKAAAEEESNGGDEPEGGHGMATTKKVCRVCEEEKAVTEFQKAKGGIHGVAATCKVCSYAKQKERAAAKRKGTPAAPPAGAVAKGARKPAVPAAKRRARRPRAPAPRMDAAPVGVVGGPATWDYLEAAHMLRIVHEGPRPEDGPLVRKLAQHRLSEILNGGV